MRLDAVVVVVPRVCGRNVRRCSGVPKVVGRADVTSIEFSVVADLRDSKVLCAVADAYTESFMSLVK